MTWSARIFVAGDPRPKGNMEALCPNMSRVRHKHPAQFPCRPIVTEDRRKGRGGKESPADKLKKWMTEIRTMARAVAPPKPTTAPVEIGCTIFMRRPKTNKRFRPTTPPDLDKMQRAIGDALTGIWYEDDAQIVDWDIEEWYAPEGKEPGAFIEVYEARTKKDEGQDLEEYIFCQQHLEGTKQ